MKRKGFYLTLIFLITILALAAFSQKKIAILKGSINNQNTIEPKVLRRLPIKEALAFVKKNKMETTLAIFIHYKLHSGKKRGYIIDLKNKIMTDSFLVSHGCGNNNWGSDESKDNPSFSNEFESHCSSLGKYKIGERAYSQWGINVKYVLHGLEASNKNALQRTIVLHGWESMPKNEPYPAGVPEGWGCPAVSNATMTKLDALLNKKKAVLLWAY